MKVATVGLANLTVNVKIASNGVSFDYLSRWSEEIEMVVSQLSG